jgi:arabinose-5-phosphate isomerase
MRVESVMLPPDQIPIVSDTEIMKAVLQSMTIHHLGIACIVDSYGILKAVLTDGDVRRMLLNVHKPAAALLSDDALRYATTQVITVKPESTLDKAVTIMGEKRIWDLPVTTADGRLLGVLHLHPAVTALLAKI